ncbi:hypothetical protein REPUB_Repub09cG0124200 [Reevesia pubescens]
MVFVKNNLSCRISNEALREAFNVYDRVVEVYISYFSKLGKVRPFTFAFVRFKFEYELTKAIEEGNYRRMDGRLIRVKKASYRHPNNGENKKAQNYMMKGTLMEFMKMLRKSMARENAMSMSNRRSEF